MAVLKKALVRKNTFSTDQKAFHNFIKKSKSFSFCKFSAGCLETFHIKIRTLRSSSEKLPQTHLCSQLERFREVLDEQKMLKAGYACLTLPKF